ncbi:ABC transporter substrate-binding protein [Rhodobacteraceae bacterium WD3A24]|nr:ABC transporter substrate-binding protein [Rhodobacteraceae bacterium WD3A24]
MRHAFASILLSAALIALAGAMAAFEVEEHGRFPGTPADGPELRLIGTAELRVFAPLIEDFQRRHPEITVDYTTASSAEIFRALMEEQARFDLAISSAMDLQLKIANDGFARSYTSRETTRLPSWARWRDQVFAFTSEPAVVVISPERFEGLELPRSRHQLVSLLRDHPERFRGAVGTYDVRESGLGYLFATQEARSSDAFWRLAEVLGRLDVQLYCCSGQMIDDVASGRLAMAYNVLGSYADQYVDPRSELEIVTLEDYRNVMLRTVLIPATAQDPARAGLFVDHLLRSGNAANFEGPRILPPLRDPAMRDTSDFGPIRLGPALLVYLDELNRTAFLDAWSNSVEQP